MTKNYTWNKLERSDLQLGAGSVLIVDETNMDSGVLSPSGVKSIMALESVVDSQNLPADFDYFKMNIPTDLCVIVLSSNKSMLRSNLVQIKLASSAINCNKISSVSDLQDNEMIVLDDSTDSDEDASATIQNRMNAEYDFFQLRVWWALCRSCSQVNIATNLLTTIEETFVKARQADANISEAEMHKWLTISRLYAVSEGCTEIQIVHWQKMLVLIENIKSNYYHRI